MLKSTKIKFILLAIVLFIISLIVIIINGGIYTYEVELNSNIKDINDLTIEIEQPEEIIKLIDQKIDNGYLKLRIEPIKKGKASIAISSPNFNSLNTLYVHNFNIISKSSYFGKSNGDIIIPICILIYISLLLISLIKTYQNNLKNNIYQYKNVAYLGIIIFLSFMLINTFIELFNYQGLESSIRYIIGSVNSFSVLLLPIAFIVSILVIISNIILLKKEGKTWKNMLGIILGIFVIFATIFPEILNNYLQRSTFIDVHNEGSIALYIHQFIESTIYIIVSYLECVLLGTIILSIKAAKYIPEYNKDYIIILGCQIRKDSSLTPLLKGRVDRAIEFAKLQKENTNKDIIFIPSGGQGNDEIISESIAIKNYLLEQGINNNKIITENKSTNTYENIKYSYDLIKDKNNSNIAFSTTNYHVFRAGNIAYNQGINMEGIGSKTKTYFWINAFIREFIATLYTEKRKHLIVIYIIMLFLIFMIALMYLSNIM